MCEWYSPTDFDKCQGDKNLSTTSSKKIKMLMDPKSQNYKTNCQPMLADIWLVPH